MLRTRVITAVIAIPVVLGAIIAGGVWFWGGAVIVGLIAAWEFSHMMRQGNYQTTHFISMTLAALLIADAYYPGLRLLPLILSVALLFALVWQLFHHSPTPTADFALNIAGGLYIGWGLGHLVALRELSDGMAWIFLALFTTWASDTFAYFTGRAIGGRLVERKLWPRHSPKKTWEGMFGGVVASIIVALIIAALVPGISYSTAAVVGLVTPIAGFFGDISISMMKRDVGVKDSSNLFPGHGGFLDRIDSVLFVSIVVYYIAIWIG